MVASKRIDRVAKVEGSRERTEAQALGRAQQMLQSQQAKYTELVSYRDEYARRFVQEGGAGLGGSQAKEYRNFLGKLNAAVDQQKRHIEQAHQECETQKGRWLQKRNRCKALDKVVDRLREEERSAKDRADQREQDEATSRRSR